MGATKKYIEDMRSVCIMPSDLYEELKDFDGLYRISEYDKNMKQFYEADEHWQQFKELEELARTNKKKVEDKIWLNMLSSK